MPPLEIDYNTLLEIATYLNGGDLDNFLVVHKDTLNRASLWVDLIQQRYNFYLKDATKKDYLFLIQLESGSFEIPSAREKAIREIASHIQKGLHEIEIRSKNPYRFWIPNNKEFSWSSSEGLYTRTKTAAGAACNFLKKNPEEIMESYFGDIEMKARCKYKSCQLICDLMERSSNPRAFPFPNKQDLITVQEKALNIIYSEEDVVTTFRNYVEDLDYPVFFSFPLLAPLE